MDIFNTRKKYVNKIQKKINILNNSLKMLSKFDKHIINDQIGSGKNKYSITGGGDTEYYGIGTPGVTPVGTPVGTQKSIKSMESRLYDDGFRDNLKQEGLPIGSEELQSQTMLQQSSNGPRQSATSSANAFDIAGFMPVAKLNQMTIDLLKAELKTTDTNAIWEATLYNMAQTNGQLGQDLQILQNNINNNLKIIERIDKESDYHLNSLYYILAKVSTLRLSSNVGFGLLPASITALQNYIKSYQINRVWNNDETHKKDQINTLVTMMKLEYENDKDKYLKDLTPEQKSNLEEKTTSWKNEQAVSIYNSISYVHKYYLSKVDHIKSYNNVKKEAAERGDVNNKDNVKDNIDPNTDHEKRPLRPELSVPPSGPPVGTQATGKQLPNGANDDPNLPEGPPNGTLDKIPNKSSNNIIPTGTLPNDDPKLSRTSTSAQPNDSKITQLKKYYKKS